MFTGIIEAVGKIESIKPLEQGLHLKLTSDQLDLADVAVGDSIAVNGICLTVTTIDHHSFTVDVSQETLNCTQGLDQINHLVNLEKAMRLSDRLGGHLVSGHIDGVGEVVKFSPQGDNYLLEIKAPQELLPFIANKGSITVNGVSLTVNLINRDVFSINLIPHTLSATTLQQLQIGDRVNLETDMLARYVAKLLNIETTRART